MRHPDRRPPGPPAPWRDQVAWLLAVVINLGYEAGALIRKLAFRGAALAQLLATTAAAWLRPWLRAFPPALTAAQKQVTADVRGLVGQELPAAWRWLRPRLAAGYLLWRGAFVARVPLGRRMALLAGRLAWHARLVIVGGFALCLMGWLLPGPVLHLAAGTVAGRVADEGLGRLAEPSVIVGPDGTTLARVSDGIERRVVPLRDIPPMVRRLVIVAEDRRFWEHDGYDMEGIGRALLANVREGDVVQGGSTITQQLAKQNFVGDRDSLSRKATEAVYAVALEERYSKSQLLGYYLNQVYFGNRAYGINAAAREYFGTGVEELGPGRAALLAGIIRSPTSLDPRRVPKQAKARRDAVLLAAAEEGVLTRADAIKLTRRPLGLVPDQPNVVHEPGVVDAVRRQFLADSAFGKTRPARLRMLETGGLRIQTTVDPSLQAVARGALADGSPAVPGGPATALAAVEPQTGRVRAMVGAGGRPGFDLASQARRQPGSAFKPFAAAAALEAGVPPDRKLPGDGPVDLAYGSDGSMRWEVDNFGGSNHGDVDLHDALVDSVNTAFAQLGVELGPGRIARVLERVGIDTKAAMGPASERGPSVALGGVARGVSPLEMAGAYGTIAAGGRHAPTTVIERVLDRHGRTLWSAAEAGARTKQALPPAVDTTLVGMLRDVVKEGTGTRARLRGWEPLGKTGTSQDAADAWFVGAVDRLSAAVWIGHPDARRSMPGSTGGQVAAPVWKEFMERALGAG